MKEVENFSYSHMMWKERKKIENQKVVSLGGKPPKKQRLPKCGTSNIEETKGERTENASRAFDSWTIWWKA